MTTDNRVKTTIEVGVNTREVRGLGKVLAEALDEKRVDRFHRALDRTAKVFDQISSSQAKLVEQMEKAARLQEQMLKQLEASQRQKRGSGSGDDGGRRGPGAMMTGFAAGVGGYVGARAANVWGGGWGSSFVPREGITAQALGALPIVGGFLRGVVEMATSYSQMAEGYQSNLARGYGSLGTSRGLRGMQKQFTRTGVDMASALPMAQQFAAQSGLRGDAQLGGVLPFSQRLNAYMGVGLESSAAFLGGAGAAGGAKATQKSLSDAVATGVSVGVRHSRLGQALQQIGQFVEQSRTSGILIDPEGISRAVRFLGGLGGAFRGEAATPAAMGMFGAMRQAPDQSSVFSMLAMQVAGYGQGKTAFEASMMLEEIENNPELLADLIARVNEMGGGEQARAIAFRREFGQLGHQLSRRQALQLAQMSPDEVRTRFSEAGGVASIDELLAQEEEAGQRAMGGAAGAAALQNRRIGVGLRAQAITRPMQNMELGLVESTIGLAVDAFRAGKEMFLDWSRTFREGGIDAVLDRFTASIRNALRDIIRPRAQQIQSAADSAGAAVGGAISEAGADIARNPIVQALLGPITAQFLERLADAIGRHIADAIRGSPRALANMVGVGDTMQPQVGGAHGVAQAVRAGQ